MRWKAREFTLLYSDVRRYPSDADDIAFVLCAVNGNATHLVTYDHGFSEVAAEYEFTICQPLEFLAVLRNSQAP